MPLAKTSELLQHAMALGYAVPAFEPYTLDQIQATIEAAAEGRAPVIVQLWSEVIETWGITTITRICLDLAERAETPVALHLDHCVDDNLIDAALDHGFTSVMFDGSSLDYEDNVRRTAAVVARARPYGAAVEAELGLIRTLGDYTTPEEALAELPSLLTPPEQAADFAGRTGVDILAPAIGSIHGCNLPLARLDIPRIRAIVEVTGLPIALHGGSGVSADQVAAAISAGVAKVNIDAEVRAIYIRALNDEVDAIGTRGKEHIDLARYPRFVRNTVRAAIIARIGMCGANGRA